MTAVPSNLAGAGGARDEAAGERLERQLEDVEREIVELKRITQGRDDLDLSAQIAVLAQRAEALQEAIASSAFSDTTRPHGAFPPRCRSLCFHS